MLDGIKIIDLSQRFSVESSKMLSIIKTGSFVYGLPELNKDEIKSANNIANPGCFATAIQLGLLPLAKAGLLKEIYTTGITGTQAQDKVYQQHRILAGGQIIFRHIKL